MEDCLEGVLLLDIYAEMMMESVYDDFSYLDPILCSSDEEDHCSDEDCYEDDIDDDNSFLYNDYSEDEENEEEGEWY